MKSKFSKTQACPHQKLTILLNKLTNFALTLQDSLITLHCQSSCSELISCITCVVATVFRHQVLYTEVVNASFLPHLILLTGMEDHAPFPPLNTNTWFRQLASQSNIITLNGILVF